MFPFTVYYVYLEPQREKGLIGKETSKFFHIGIAIVLNGWRFMAYVSDYTVNASRQAV